MSLKTDVENYKRAQLRYYFDEAGGNIKRMAELAGMNRTALHNLIRRYGMKSTFKPQGGNAAWNELGGSA